MDSEVCGKITCSQGEKIREMHLAIYGNGDPKKGLYWMVTKNSEFIRGLEKLFWPLVTACLIGSGSAAITLVKQMFLHLNK